MIKLKCPKCERWVESEARTGDIVCGSCGQLFTIGRGK
jgi:DNA-directed RNA polymerase subunit RPC12/RpoP